MAIENNNDHNDHQADIEPDIRSALEDAFEETPADEPVTPEPVEREGAAPDAESDSRTRDEHGRFAPKQPADKLGAPGEPPRQGVEPKAPENAPSEPLKAPQSYSPAAREHWNELPPVVQQEIMRREHETQQVLQHSAQARGFMDAFAQTVRPFEAHIIAEGSDPLTAFRNLMTFGARLRTDPPAAKAELIAGLIQQYGVDVQALDSALAGKPLPQTQQQPMQDPRVDQLLQERQMMFAQIQQRQAAEVQQTVVSFSQGKEFFEDVREIMADLVDVAARNGKELSLDDAYKRACMLHPEVSTIVEKRTAAEKAQQTSEAARRARRAASSVRGTTPEPGATGEDQSETVRAALEQAFASART